MASADAVADMALARKLQRELAEARSELDALKSGGGNGTSGGVTDDWKASVDRQLGQLHGDVRALLRWGIAAVIGLAAMIAGLYVRVDTKFETVNARVAALEVQQVRSNAELNAKLDTLLDRVPPHK